MSDEIQAAVDKAVRIALADSNRRGAQTEALPAALIPTALKFVTNGWGVALIVGSFFGLKLFFAEIKIDRVTAKYDASQILLENERNTSASLIANVNSLQSQAARKAADEAAASAAKDVLDDEPVTSFNPPSIKRAIGILRGDQQTTVDEENSSASGEPIVPRRARGTTPRRD